MTSKKIKTVSGYTALSKALSTLDLIDLADPIEIKKPSDYPATPYAYSGDIIAIWPSKNGKFYAWPEVKQRKYEIFEFSGIDLTSL